MVRPDFGAVKGGPAGMPGLIESTRWDNVQIRGESRPSASHPVTARRTATVCLLKALLALASDCPAAEALIESLQETDQP